MEFIEAIVNSLTYHLRANWNILLFGIVLAVGINVYLEPAKLRAFLSRRAGFSIPGAVAFGSLTPLCACGSMAVLVSMFAAAMPWGAVMAFLISSPLASPSDYMFQTAFLGSKFALAMLASSLALGVTGGLLAHLLEKRTSFFHGQFRLLGKNKATGEESHPIDCVESACASTACCGRATWQERIKLNELIDVLWAVGVKRILLYFVLFISVGAIVELIIPSQWIYSVFGGDKEHSILLSALVGLPLYVSGSSSLPILSSLMNAGAGQGAILAFLIAGQGTSVPVVLGMSTFLKPRAIVAYASFIFVGSIIAAYLYQWILLLAV